MSGENYPSNTHSDKDRYPVGRNEEQWLGDSRASDPFNESIVETLEPDTRERNGSVLREFRGGMTRTSAKSPNLVRYNRVDKKDIKSRWRAGSVEERRAEERN